VTLLVRQVLPDRPRRYHEPRRRIVRGSTRI